MKKKNTILLYLYSFLSTFLLFRSCDTLYYLEKGVSSSKYVLFTSIAALITFIFQIPISTLGDRFDKKKILFISNLFSFLSIIIFIVSNNYIGLVFGIIFQTLQTLFANGLINSIMYEKEKDKKKFSKAMFYKSLFAYTGYGLAMILGGIVGDKSLVAMYYLSLIPISINFIVILLLDSMKKTNTKNNNLNIYKDAISIIKNKDIIKYLFLMEGFLASFVTIMAETHPEYSQKLGINATTIGIYTAFMLVFGILGEYVATKIKSDKVKVFYIPIIINLVIIAIGLFNSVYCIVLIVLTQFLYDIQFNGLYSIMHDTINDESRVTMEGFLSQVIAVFGITVGLVGTMILKYFKVNNIYVILGIVSIIYIIIIYLFFKKKIVKLLK